MNAKLALDYSKAAVDFLLSNHSLESLKNMCRECGLSSSGTKKVLAGILLQSIHSRRPFDRLVSFDLGIKNFAQSIIDFKDPSRNIVLSWRTSSLDFPETYDSRQNAFLIKKLVESEIYSKFITDRTVFLVERQTCRGSGVRMIPGNILRLNKLEVQLHCFLLDRNVEQIDPRHVAFTHQLERKNKKTAAVKMVTELLSKGDNLFVDQSLRQIFKEAPKKDDLADSLLQGLAYIQWSRKLDSLGRTIMSKIGNKA